MKYLFTLLFLLPTFCLAQQLSITSVTPNPVCAGSSITAFYSYNNTSGDAGVIYMYLNGPSTNDVLIAAVSANGGNGSLPGTIPGDRITGTYTVRLIRQSNTTGSIVIGPSSTGFTVNARPSAPGVSNVAYCLGATGVSALTATGQNLRWYPVSSGGGGTTTAPTPPTSTTGTTNYYVSQTINGCEGPRATLQVTINPPPAKPTVASSLSYCQGSNPPSLAGAVTSGSNLKWYSSVTGGVGSTIAPTPSTTVVGSTTFYVSQTNFSNQTDGSGCESERAEITVTIKAVPVAPAVSTPVIYCQNAVASPLSATGVQGSSLNWFGPANNALGSTAPTPPTTAPGTTYYSVSQTVSGCTGAPSTIQVTINSRPVAPTTTPVNVCQNTTPISLATGVTSGSNLRWYTNSSGGTGSTVAPSPPTSSVGQTPYYVSQIDNNGCESDRSVLTFVVNGYPGAPGVSALAYCQNATATSLTATPAANATLNFYLGSTGGTRYASLTPSTTASNNYYVSQTVNGCEGPRAIITVSIRSLPPSPSVTIPAGYCQFAAAAPLSATANTNFTLNWYGPNATGGTASGVVSTPSTSSAGLFHYYVSQSDPFGCESVRADIPVTVNTKPAVPVVTNASACLNTVPGSLSLSVTATGTLKWYIASSGGTGSTLAPTLSTSATGSATYYVSQTSGEGCESDRAAITFTVNPLPAAPTVGSPLLVFCQNVSAVPLQTAVTSGSNLKWYTAQTGGTQYVGTPVLSTSAVGSTSYYASQTDANGCESERSAIQVTITTLPTPTLVASNGSVLTCTQSSLTLTAGGGSTYQFSGPGVVSTSANVAMVNAGGTYSVTVTGDNSCTASQSTTVLSNTAATPVSLTASGPLSCSVSVVSLTATAGFSTYLFSSGATQSGGSSGNTALVNASGSYSVTAINGAGCSSTAVVSVTYQNCPPTLVNTISPQSATVGQPFSYTIPANTFTDAETPNSLTLSVAGLPAGLSFVSPNTITGTASASATAFYSVTVTATDPAGRSVSTILPLNIVNPGGCGSMSTLKAGDWNDPSVWSCNRIPLITDAVTLNHAVSLPPTYQAQAQRVIYNTTGRLIFGSTSRLRLGGN